MNIAMDYSWYAKDNDWQQNYCTLFQNFLFCRGIDTFEDQFNVDGSLPEWILPAGGFRKLRHSLGLVSTSAAASIMGTQAKSWKFVDAVWNAKLEPYEDGYFDPYYDGLLYLFSLMHLSGPSVEIELKQKQQLLMFLRFLLLKLFLQFSFPRLMHLSGLSMEIELKKC